MQQSIQGIRGSIHCKGTYARPRSRAQNGKSQSETPSTRDREGDLLVSRCFSRLYYFELQAHLRAKDSAHPTLCHVPPLSAKS
jgi:hypothetical protein